MAHRLYPITVVSMEDHIAKAVDGQLLVDLVNATHGTAYTLEQLAEYEAFEATKPGHDAEYDAAEEWFTTLFHTPHFNAFNDFELFGWGRMTREVVDYVETQGEEYYCGTLVGEQHVRALLAAQGVSLPAELIARIDGMCWS